MQTVVYDLFLQRKLIKAHKIFLINIERDAVVFNLNSTLEYSINI